MPQNRNYDNFTNLDTQKGIMGDFTHASNLYRRNNFRLAPKVKFLYHVVIEINAVALRTLGSSVSSILNKREFNILASSASLPSFDAQTETLNQYNRKKVIQTRINYAPVNIEFHDDAAGLTTLLWESYYRYYYEDGNYADQGTRPKAYQTGLYDSEQQNTYRHGFNRSRKAEPFFNSISIHQLHHQNTDSYFTSFTLVNPLIQSWEHDRLDQSDGSGTMKNTMRVEYETVLYDRDKTATDNPAGFADNAHYDKSPSPYISTGTGNTTGNTTGTTNGWTQVFTDIISSVINQTNFNSEQQRNLRLGSALPVTTDNRVPFSTNAFFPTNSTEKAITTAFLDAAPDDFGRNIIQRELRSDISLQRSLARQALRNYTFVGTSNVDTFNERTSLFDKLDKQRQQDLQEIVVDNYITDTNLTSKSVYFAIDAVLNGEGYRSEQETEQFNQEIALQQQAEALALLQQAEVAAQQQAEAEALLQGLLGQNT